MEAFKDDFFKGLSFRECIFGGSALLVGVGGILLNAISETNPDHDLAMAALAFYTIIGLATTLVVDLSYGIVDPRIRMGAK